MATNASRPVSSMDLLSLPEEVILTVLSYFDSTELCLVEITCSYFRTLLDTSKLWKLLCDKDFSSFPRYRCQTNGYPKDSFKLSYQWLLQEVKRERITVNDLDTLDWLFNYHPLAGGMGRLTLVSCSFDVSFLSLHPFPPLPYSIEDDGSILQISDFPPHDISRLPDGEWLIKNENVTFVSHDTRGTLNYRGRGFQ